VEIGHRPFGESIRLYGEEVRRRATRSHDQKTQDEAKEPPPPLPIPRPLDTSDHRGLPKILSRKNYLDPLLHAKDPGVTLPDVPTIWLAARKASFESRIPPSAMPSNRSLFSLLLFGALLGASGILSPLAGQDPIPATEGDRSRVRLGINLGGTGLVGISFELLRGNQGYEAVLGTLSFRDISLSIAAKHYLASGKLRPAAGIGFWGMAARTEEGSGSVLLLRLPVAVEWRVTDSDALALEVGFNRGLLVNRLDPDDDTPVRKNIIPFPGAYYRRSFDR